MIPDPLLVPVLVLAGCGVAAGWTLAVLWAALGAPPPARLHDPARCEACAAAPDVDPERVARRLARYVAGRTPGRSA